MKRLSHIVLLCIFIISGPAVAGVSADIYNAADSGNYPNVVLLVNSVPASGSEHSLSKVALIYALSQMAIDCKTYSLTRALSAWNVKFRSDTIPSGTVEHLADVKEDRACTRDVLG